MRRYLVLFLCLLKDQGIQGYANAPGIYPEEEMNAGNELEVPKNPYQSGWTGYEYYYEKKAESTPAPASGGHMPAFQPIDSIYSDKESPDDGYTASGRESEAYKKVVTTVSPKAAQSGEKVKAPASIRIQAPAPAPASSRQMPAFQPTESIYSDKESPEDGYTASGRESGAYKKVRTTVPPKAAPSGEKVKVSASMRTKDFPVITTTTTSFTPTVVTKTMSTTLKINERSTTTSRFVVTTEAPRAPPSSEAPYSQPSSEAPRVSLTSEAPHSQPSSEAPYSPPSSEAPHSQPLSEAPRAPPSSEAPYSQPSSEAPRAPPSSEAPYAPPFPEAPRAPPSSEAPYSPPFPEAPRAPPSSEAPHSQPSSEAPRAPPSSEAPHSQPSSEAPYSPPSSEAPHLQPLSEAPRAPPTSEAPYAPSLSEAPHSQPTSEAPYAPSLSEAPYSPPSSEAPLAPSKLSNPESVTDKSVADIFDSLYGGVGDKDHSSKKVQPTLQSYDPPPPAAQQNLLTQLIRKTSKSTPKPNTERKIPTESSIGGPDGHDSGYPEVMQEEGKAPGIEPNAPDTLGNGPAGPEIYGPSGKTDISRTESTTSGSIIVVMSPSQSTSSPSNLLYQIAAQKSKSSGQSEYSPPRQDSEESFEPSLYENANRNSVPDSESTTNPAPFTENYSVLHATPPRIHIASMFSEAPESDDKNSYPEEPYSSQTTEPSTVSNKFAPSYTDPYPATETGHFDMNKSGNQMKLHGNAPGIGPSPPAADISDSGYGSNIHSGNAPTGTPPRTSSNSISPEDPYEHQPAPPPHHSDSYENSSLEEHPDGYGADAVDAPSRAEHSTTSTKTRARAQVSEIDRIVESFENSAREPVEYDPIITSESSKGITSFGRKIRKCCSCCEEKRPVTTNGKSTLDPRNAQQYVDQPQPIDRKEPVQDFVSLQTNGGGSGYLPAQPVLQPQQTHYQQPFQVYQPQYPQSYPAQQPACGCQPQPPPQNCCPPPAPCCLPTVPCCPTIPCCPQPKICCQPAPVCAPPPPTCCSINLQLPSISICGRACPSCPCRRRVHKSRRLRRHAISSSCHRCSASGEPWSFVLHKRAKRSCASEPRQQSSCGTCGASNIRSQRVKRMGCIPCLGRKKRNSEDVPHIRIKRTICLPCNGRKKRSALSQPTPAGCSQCNSLGHLFNRYKRSLFGGCSPCAPQVQPPCGCGRKKRSPEQCDATCCDYSRCQQRRQKKETLVPFM